ncbi:hypothetical protein C8F01DRAFT_1156821, partial [Mycena amicta]
MLHLVLVLLTIFTAAALGRYAQARAPQASTVPNPNKPYAPAYFCPSPTNNYQQWTGISPDDTSVGRLSCQITGGRICLYEL